MKIQIYGIALVILSIAFIYTGCSKSSVTPPPPSNPCAGKTITVTGTTTAASTPTATNGAISATATGSTNFTFSLNGGAFQASGNFNNLAVGTYSVTAKDAAGCTGSQSFSVTAIPCPTITVSATVTQASSPAANNGAIAATAAGSTGFTYSITGISGTYQASGTFTGLAVGSYTIFAKDAAGCTGSNSFSVTAASCPTITLSTVPTNTAGPTATNGSIAASASGGVLPYQYSKDGGTTFQASGNFSNLGVGTYNVVAKDANGCLSNSVNTNVGFTCPVINTSATSTQTIKCETNTGTITVSATGSTGFMYNLNGGTYQGSNIFAALAASAYTFGVRDINGCTATGNTAVAQAPAGTLFLAVKAVLQVNCAVSGCHLSPNPQNGLDFTEDCTIVAQSIRIKARAVDANPSQMPPTGPPLSAVDKQKIIDWINAGGKHNN